MRFGFGVDQVSRRAGLRPALRIDRRLVRLGRLHHDEGRDGFVDVAGLVDELTAQKIDERLMGFQALHQPAGGGIGIEELRHLTFDISSTVCTGDGSMQVIS